MRWVIINLILLFSYAFYVSIDAQADDRRQVLEMMQAEKEAGVKTSTQHCVIYFDDDGNETKTCQEMDDVPSPIAIFKCHTVDKQLVCGI